MADPIKTEKPKLVVRENFDDLKVPIDKRWDAFVDPSCYNPDKKKGLVALDRGLPELKLPDVFPTKEGRGSVIRYSVPKGADEEKPVTLAVESKAKMKAFTGKESVGEFCLRFKMKLPEDSGQPSSSQKIVRFVSTWQEPGGAKGRLEYNFWTQAGNTNLQAFCFYADGKNPEIDKFKNTESGFPVGKWVDVSVWTKLNAPGKEDGFMVVELDGKAIIDHRGLSLRGKSDRGFDNMFFLGNVSNKGPLEKQVEVLADDFEWWSTKPSDDDIKESQKPKKK